MKNYMTLLMLISLVGSQSLFSVPIAPESESVTPMQEPIRENSAAVIGFVVVEYHARTQHVQDVPQQANQTVAISRSSYVSTPCGDIRSLSPFLRYSYENADRFYTYFP